jgi:hypothetical protein
MPISSVRCRVLGADVTRVTDLDGSVTRLIYSAYHEPTGICRLMTNAQSGGPLSRLLERVAEDTLDIPSARCIFALRQGART